MAQTERLTIFGHSDPLSGVARHGSAFADAIASHVEVAWVPLDRPLPPSSPSWIRRFERGRQETSPSTALGIGAPDVMSRLRGHRRIGWFVWETSRVPDSHLQHLRGLDEIWTPTDWGRRVLSESGLQNVPVEVVPEGVDPDVFRPIPRCGVENQPFRFLAVGKWERRKGFDLLLRAWARAFAANAPVELVLHTYHTKDPRWRLEHALHSLELGPHAPIRWSRPLPLVSLVLLYNQCDAFVSATRGEAWGLPIFEAMSCAKPVIVPRSGALGELLHESFVDFVEVDEVPASYGGGEASFGGIGRWGEPNIDHLVTLLREAVQDPKRGLELGERGRSQVLDRWTWARSAEIAFERICETPEVRGV